MRVACILEKDDDGVEGTGTGIVAALVNALLLVPENGAPSIKGEVEVDDEDIPPPSMLEILLFELVLLKGGGARKDGEVPPVDVRLMESELEEEERGLLCPTVKKGKVVAALLNPSPAFEGPLPLPLPFALSFALNRPYRAGDEGGEEESRLVIRDVLALGA